jgi:hypothetical protein
VSHDSWDPSINPPISGSGEFIGDYQGLTADDCLSVWFANDTHLANGGTRDPGHDSGYPRSRFQEVFAWRIPHPNPAHPAACRDTLAGLGSLAANFTPADAGPGGTTAGVRGGRFVISRRAIKLTRSGKVRVRVSCRTPLGCSGRLKIGTARRVRLRPRSRARIRALGAKRFAMSGGAKRNAIVTIQLSRSERALINRLRRTPILASALVTIGDNALRGRAAARFRLHRPSR